MLSFTFSNAHSWRCRETNGYYEKEVMLGMAVVVAIRLDDARSDCPLCHPNINGGILQAKVCKVCLQMCIEPLYYPGLYLPHPFS